VDQRRNSKQMDLIIDKTVEGDEERVSSLTTLPSMQLND
jgi:hypothetical protein